jgi:hypothetical protein
MIKQGMVAAINSKVDEAGTAGDVETLKRVLQALNLSDSVAECATGKLPVNVAEEAPPDVSAAPPGDAAAAPAPVAPPMGESQPDDPESIFASLDTNGDGQISLGELQSAPPDLQQKLASADTNGDGMISKDEFLAVMSGGGTPAKESAPAVPPAGPTITADATDRPAPPMGAPEAKPGAPPWLKNKAPESAVVDRSGLVMECADLLTASGVPATGVVLEAMVNLPTIEKRQAYAKTLAESRIPGIPESLRIARSASPPAPTAKPNAVIESTSTAEGFAKFLRQKHQSN